MEEHILSILASLDVGRYQTYLLAEPALIKAFGEDLTRLKTKVVPIHIVHDLDTRAAARFMTFIKRVRPHIIHSHMFIAGFFYSPLARMAGVPVVLETVHGIERHRVEKGFWGRGSFLVDRIWSVFTDAYIGVSHACARDMNKIKGIPKRKITVIHNGRDLTFYRPTSPEIRNEVRNELSIGPEEFVFGVVGRLDYQKGHTYLLQAAEKLKRAGRKFRVLLVGDGPYEARLKQEASELGLADIVVWAGFRKDVVRMLAALDVKVLPSLYEGLPLVAIEALATETPMIATKVDGNPEVVLDRETGIICRERNPEDLAGAMAWAQDNFHEMKTMAIKGREYVLKEYSIEKQMVETEALYRSLMAKKVWKA